VNIPVGLVLELELELPLDELLLLSMLLLVEVGNELLIVPIFEAPGPNSNLIGVSGGEL
jgi:hypothetical protein